MPLGMLKTWLKHQAFGYVFTPSFEQLLTVSVDQQELCESVPYTGHWCCIDGQQTI